MLHAARCKCRTQKSCQKSPSGHHPTTLSGYIFATKACIDSRKKLVKQHLLYMCPQYVNFGPLAAEIVSLVWGTPANFNGFRVLAALLHGTIVVGVSQTATFNRGRHLYSAGRPSRWALAHISGLLFLCTCHFHLKISIRQLSASNRGCFINIPLPNAYYMSFCSKKCGLSDQDCDQADWRFLTEHIFRNKMTHSMHLAKEC